MNRTPLNGDSIVPYAGLPYPEGFEGCWAGELAAPFGSLQRCICLGSVDGNLLLMDQDFSRQEEGRGKASASGEAINGVAGLATWVAVSTRSEVSFFASTKSPGGVYPHGAHGVIASPSGYFIAPLGKAGILTAKPSGDEMSLMAHTPGDGTLNIYRILSLCTRTGVEFLVSAARRGGLVAGAFSASEKANPMRTARFANVDVVDVCSLYPEVEPLAVAALGRDGSLILFRDVLNDKTTKTFRFQAIKGVPYRILSHQGDIYVLTSQGLYVLGRLGSRFVNNETMERITTPVMPLAMAAIDMNLAWGRWLLVVLANEVRKFDVDLIHEFVPQHIGQGEIRELESISPSIESEWSDIHSTTSTLAAAS